MVKRHDLATTFVAHRISARSLSPRLDGRGSKVNESISFSPDTLDHIPVSSGMGTLLPGYPLIVHKQSCMHVAKYFSRENQKYK